MEIKQYDLVLVNLDPTVGSEMQKTRPCLVVSPDEMNKHLQTIVIAPVTSSAKPYPTRVKVTGKNITGWVVLDQIRTVDKLRMIKVLGKLTTTEIEAIKSVIRETYVD